jgi:hypothetical protein
MGVICFIAGFIMGVVGVLVITLGLGANTPDDDEYHSD